MLQLSNGVPNPSKETRLEFLESIVKMPHMGLDTEGYNILGISLAYGPAGMYFPINHMESDANIDDEVYDELLAAIQASRLPVIHNAAHDIKKLEPLGIHLPRFACTMIIAHMIDEEVISKKLDYLHKYYTGGEGKNRPALMQEIIDTMGWEYVPVTLMNVYASQDAIAHSELFMALEPLYVEQFGPLYND